MNSTRFALSRSRPKPEHRLVVETLAVDVDRRQIDLLTVSDGEIVGADHRTYLRLPLFQAVLCAFFLFVFHGGDLLVTSLTTHLMDPTRFVQACLASALGTDSEPGQ